MLFSKFNVPISGAWLQPYLQTANKVSVGGPFRPLLKEPRANGNGGDKGKNPTISDRRPGGMVEDAVDRGGKYSLDSSFLAGHTGG